MAGMMSDEIYRTQHGGGNIGDAIAAAAPLLAFFRERKLPVIFARILYADDGSDAGLWCERAPRLRLLTESADVSQVVSELAPRAGEFVVRKTQASAFFGTHLGSVLTGRAIDTLVVTGCTTSGCVRASVVDAMSMNFRTAVASYAVGAGPTGRMGRICSTWVRNTPICSRSGR
jgi:maleamate amidohydrolase